jgi:hypothetical protein
VFVLDHKWVRDNSIFQVQRQRQLTVTGFAGHPEGSAGKAFTPNLLLSIKNYTTTVLCELATLEPEIDIIIPGRWFMLQHRLSFDEGDIQVGKHECHSPPGVIYDENLIHDPEAQITGSISAAEPHTQESLRQHIPTEYHQYIHLFTD